MNTALNYQPEVLVDTADLSRRRFGWIIGVLGIGGSDAAVNHGLIPIFDNQGFVFR